jgi:hypothetical protein
MWRIYSYPDPHGSAIFEKKRKKGEKKTEIFKKKEKRLIRQDLTLSNQLVFRLFSDEMGF